MGLLSMMGKTQRELVFAAADDLLMAGIEPSVRQLAARLPELDDILLQQALQDWWLQVPQRVQFRMPIAADLPKEVVTTISQLWEHAVKHASDQLEAERRNMQMRLDELEQDKVHQLERMRGESEAQELRIEQLKERVEELEQRNKALQAEVSVLKANLHAETQTRNQYEEREREARHELERVAKSKEEMRQQFDQRLKEEQARAQEQLAKQKSEVSHLRLVIEQNKDESGKKEAALTRQIHDLQAEVARGEVKVETQQTQIRNLEQELKGYRLETANSNRDATKLNAQILAEVNKNKRLEDRVQQLEHEYKELNKKLSSNAMDSARREAELRQQVNERDDELLKLKAQLKQQQSNLLAREEEVKRLQARLHA